MRTAAMPTASVKVGKAGWNSATCSTRMLAAMPAGTKHRVLRGDAPLVAGARHQHADAIHVTGGQHVRQAAAQIRADLDISPGGGNAHGVGAERVGVAGQPTAKNTSSTSNRACSLPERYCTATPAGVRSSRSTSVAVSTVIPWRRKESAS